MLQKLLRRLSRHAAERMVAEGQRAEAAGRLQEACERYQAALKFVPDHVPAYLSLGVALEASGNAGAAREAYRAALEIDPANAYAHFNLGKLLHVSGSPHVLAESAEQLRAALQHKPDFTDARIVLASVLEAQGDADGAMQALRRAIEDEPANAGAWYNHALLLQRLDHLAEAEAAMRRTLELWPQRADVWLRQGELLKMLQRLPESEAALRRALELDPKLASACRLLAGVLAEQLRMDEALRTLAAGREHDAEGYTRAFELSMLNYHDAIPADQLFARHKEFGAEVERVQLPRFHGFAGSRDPERKLRIGYLSGDFREHPVGRAMVPLVERIDRSRFDVYCYSLFGAADDVTRAIGYKVTQWHDASGLSPREVAGFIHNDRIDILIDLSGYGGVPTFDILASRPAPVQAGWLGYASTCGLTRVDYRITDAFADPPGVAERHHTEKLVRLPDAQWCYRPLSDAAPQAEPPCVRNGYVTFGSFNQAAKLSPSARRLWAEILRGTPGSRLLVVGVPSGPATSALLQDFERQGVAPERIAVEPRLGLQDYFLRLRSADVALDSLPCSGGATACDALWMGTPVLTLPSSRTASRSACSALGVLGLKEWMAKTPEDYVAQAMRAGRDPAWLAAERSKLRERMRASPLMDEAKFARDMEALYRQIWRTWCGTVNSS